MIGRAGTARGALAVPTAACGAAVAAADFIPVAAKTGPTGLVAKSHLILLAGTVGGGPTVPTAAWLSAAVYSSTERTGSPVSIVLPISHWQE